MTISSRTPEGDPNLCPICGHDFRLEPSIDTQDAPCPACGSLVWWFIRNRIVVPAKFGFREIGLVPIGSTRLGQLPTELKGRWIEMVDDITRRKKVPMCFDLHDLVAEATSWQDLIDRIEKWSRRSLLQRVIHVLKKVGKPRYYCKAEIMYVARKGS